MLDSECRERTEMAESERRGVLMGGCSMETGTSQPAGRAGLNPCAHRGHWAPPGPPCLSGHSLSLQGPWCVRGEPCNAQAPSCPAVLALLGRLLSSANFLCVNGETSCYSILRGHSRPTSCFP